jgi:ATP-dependent Lon protease
MLTELSQNQKEKYLISHICVIQNILKYTKTEEQNSGYRRRTESKEMYMTVYKLA